ncbi:MAG: single-stranded DNA-binding protein [Pedosphaera sp. Tous-C6FEB]|nr:MAG: single-stranded DNA-binding protein [Pedosphaera sp. Tous-C6FEB]
MANFNKVILAGNMTRDPELRYTPKGTAIAKFGLAINRNWTSEDGQKREEVTFVDVDAFGKQAEVIGQYLRKGRPVLVEGRLKLDQWDDKQTGQKRSRLGVVLESFSFLDSGNRDGAGASGASSSAPSVARPSRPAATPPSEPSADEPPQGDDVPF